MSSSPVSRGLRPKDGAGTFGTGTDPEHSEREPPALGERPALRALGHPSQLTCRGSLSPPQESEEAMAVVACSPSHHCEGDHT